MTNQNRRRKRPGDAAQPGTGSSARWLTYSAMPPSNASQRWSPTVSGSLPIAWRIVGLSRGRCRQGTGRSAAAPRRRPHRQGKRAPRLRCGPVTVWIGWSAHRVRLRLRRRSESSCSAEDRQPRIPAGRWRTGSSRCVRPRRLGTGLAAGVRHGDGSIDPVAWSHSNYSVYAMTPARPNLLSAAAATPPMVPSLFFRLHSYCNMPSPRLPRGSTLTHCCTMLRRAPWRGPAGVAGGRHGPRRPAVAHSAAGCRVGASRPGREGVTAIAVCLLLVRCAHS